MEAIRNLLRLDGKQMQNEVLKTKPQLQEAFKKCQYLHPSEVERDVIEATSTYPSLAAYTDVFVSNDGFEHNLVCLCGTIPVNFKGSLYQTPICIWLSKEHPNLPPLVQVKPTTTMVIKVGNNVDHGGMVSVPYLDEWGSSSDLVGLIEVLCVVFGESAPLYLKTATTTTTAVDTNVSNKRISTTPPQNTYPPSSTVATIHRQDGHATAHRHDNATDGNGTAIGGATSARTCEKADKQIYANVDDTEVSMYANVGDTLKSRRANLLLDVDATLTSTRIVKEQTEGLIVILEKAKAKLIKGSLDNSQINEMYREKKVVNDWLGRLKSDISDLGAKSNQLASNALDLEKNNSTCGRNVMRSRPSSYQDWSTDDVCGWLESINMSEIVASVRQHCIRGAHLPNLDKNDLIELGVVKLGQRMTLDDEINKLLNFEIVA